MQGLVREWHLSDLFQLLNPLIYFASFECPVTAEAFLLPVLVWGGLFNFSQRHLSRPDGGAIVPLPALRCHVQAEA